jgi:rhomboid protease GlpG
MRLIGELSNETQVDTLCPYLESQGIRIAVDRAGNGFHLWVIDEDQVAKATEIYRQFLEHPEDVKFKGGADRARLAKAVDGVTGPSPMRRRFGAPMGKVTLFLMLVCTVLLIWAEMVAPAGVERSKSPIFREGSLLLSLPYSITLFDYPAPWEAAYQLAHNYPVNEIEAPQALPPAGQLLYANAMRLPAFDGFYDLLLRYWKNPELGWPQAAPMFVKIGQGEVWRLFTPALLHGSLLHLFVNLLWMIVLGNQVEARLGALRYLAFILVAGVISNTVQYLMNGPAFLGISGVVCALFGLVWMRQRVAPWEGYLLNRPTIIFVMIFLIGMVVLQGVSLVLELRGVSPLPIGIANAAHMTGLAVGLILGRLNLSSYRTA